MNVVLDTDRVSLVQGDSLAVLRSFATKSVDVACFDPPYSNHVHDKFGKERRTDGHAVPDALAFPPMTPELINSVMIELIRVTRTWIIAFTDFYNTYHWGHAARSNGGAWVRTGQWVKTNPKPQMTADRPGCGTEDILIAHADANPGAWDWNGGGHAATWRGRRDPTYKFPDDTMHPGRGTGHPNQKPAWLLQSLLGMFCRPGDLVIDPYAGSFTTAIGALAQERLPGESPLETACPACAKKILEQYAPPLPDGVRVVGVEGDPIYVDLAIRRIREAAPSLLAA